MSVHLTETTRTFGSDYSIVQSFWDGGQRTKCQDCAADAGFERGDAHFKRLDPKGDDGLRSDLRSVL